VSVPENWASSETGRMCNLYSITTNQAAIIALFRGSDDGD
jgi:hypothetical protein